MTDYPISPGLVALLFFGAGVVSSLGVVFLRVLMRGVIPPQSPTGTPPPTGVPAIPVIREDAIEAARRLIARRDSINRLALRADAIAERIHHLERTIYESLRMPVPAPLSPIAQSLRDSAQFQPLDDFTVEESTAPGGGNSVHTGPHRRIP